VCSFLDILFVSDPGDYKGMERGRRHKRYSVGYFLSAARVQYMAAQVRLPASCTCTPSLNQPVIGQPG
jgi:hypothetical protein